MTVGVLTSLREDDVETVLPDRVPVFKVQATPGTIGADTTGLPVSSRGVRHAGGSRTQQGPLDIGQMLGPRYRIVRLLGIGGMGAVYQAWDAELSVMVALKVIRSDVTADSTASPAIERRFKQELLLARQVTHKNVVRIHDLGEIDGIKYITMPYIEGADLATVLRQKGKLTVQAVMPLARQMVAGLRAAHEAGVIHRDLKPANIMIEEGRAIIMDFGIAHSAQLAGTPTQGHGMTAGQIERAWEDAVTRAAATEAGTVIGTIEYMAPEQAKGLAVDQRADIYAFGLILYDLLAGRRHTEQTAAIAELMSRMEQPLPSARSLVPEIPDVLDKLVSRCIEPDLAKRYQTTNELATDLDRLDEYGEPIPVRRVVGLPFLAAVVSLLVALSGGTFWYLRQSIPPVPHDPVSVLIADFQNGTGDPTFDGTLEPVLKLALEGAGFISAYDRAGISRTLGVQPPEKLDDRTAQEIAVKQGVGVVLSGSLDRQPRGYGVSVAATQAVSGTVITRAQGTAADKDRVLEVATRLATTVRRALGDDTSESAQRFALQTLTAASLEAVHDFAVGMLAFSDNRNEDALRSFAKAVARDPNFGAAYAAMGIASRNMGQQQDAEKYINEAVRRVDRMTERERYRARGLYYAVTGDYQACVKEYGDLIAQYPADAAAHNNLALCLSYLRNMSRAVDEMRSLVSLLPRRALYRVNFALYSAYGSDFQSAEQEARTAQELGSPLGYFALAFAQLGQNQVLQATESYRQMAKNGPQGASYAASGLADLAVYEGRFSDAVRILREGAAADLSSNKSDRAAAKLAALAHAELLRNQKGAAIAAARDALAHSKAVKIRFLAARVLAEGGDIAQAQTLAAELGSELQTEPQTLAKVLEGELALKNGNPRQAVKVLTEANGLLDTWIGHFDLGRAYLATGLFMQADSEFDRCIKRRGEALSLFLDEEPTYGHFPAAYYYQGRAREGQKAGFAESYKTYLGIRGQAAEDPLLEDVRARAGR
jgi:eukaryotic-like serine/threonine-protein kinase